MAFANNFSLLDSSKTVMIFDGSFRAQFQTKLEDPHKRFTPYQRLEFNKNNHVLVRNIHLDFLNAGANVIRTNTYWATESYIKQFDKTRCEEHCVELIQAGVSRAREAVNTIFNQQSGARNYFIVGSCGSATNTKGDIDMFNPKKIKDFHRLRAHTFLSYGVDALAFENIECAEEAKALVELMGEFPYGKAFMSFQSHKGMETTMRYGDNIYETALHCCESLQSQLTAIGFSCCFPERVSDYLYNFNVIRNGQNTVPLAVYPKMHRDMPRNSEEPFDFAKQYSVSEWPTMGASYIGGCCHMLSQDICSISSIINSCQQFPSN